MGSLCDQGCGVVVRLPRWADPDSARARLRRTAVLILDPADAHAAGGDPAVGHLFERIQRTVLHQVA